MSSRRTVYQEAIRYLGYGNTKPDEETIYLIHECLKELQTIAERKRAVFRVFPVFVRQQEIQLGELRIISRDLAVNLKGCREAAVFAATLGAEVDRRIHRYEYTNMARAVVLQACAAAVLEEYCDQIQEEIGKKAGSRYLRPRFSPGYGDFSIFIQKNLLEVLDAPKQIGLMTTEASMLTPIKSVTAVIGIADTCASAVERGCSMCGKQDCSYRIDDRR